MQKQTIPLRVLNGPAAPPAGAAQKFWNIVDVSDEEAAGRRGNLAVPDQITGKPSAKTQLPSRDCHVASLLGMTSLNVSRR